MKFSVSKESTPFQAYEVTFSVDSEEEHRALHYMSHYSAQIPSIVSEGARKSEWSGLKAITYSQVFDVTQRFLRGLNDAFGKAQAIR